MTATPGNILDTIKKMLGIDPSDTSFDTDVITDINSAFMTLNQLGVGSTEIFSIADNTKLWPDFFGTTVNIDAAKSYIYLKVKLLFDPPTNQSLLDAIKNQITEFEWRLAIQVEPPLVVLPLEGGEDEVNWG